MIVTNFSKDWMKNWERLQDKSKLSYTRLKNKSSTLKSKLIHITNIIVVQHKKNNIYMYIERSEFIYWWGLEWKNNAKCKVLLYKEFFFNIKTNMQSYFESKYEIT